jgi:hypothetical protein
MISPPKRRWCPGHDAAVGVHVACPAAVELPINRHNRKRCEDCARRQKAARAALKWRESPSLQQRLQEQRRARRQLAAVQPKATKPCQGSIYGPCPDQALIQDRARFKRCKACGHRQQHQVRQESHARNWPKYREQRKQRAKQERVRQDLEQHPLRERLFELAIDAGLLGREA